MDGWWKERWIGKRKDGMRMMRGGGFDGMFLWRKGWTYHGRPREEG